MAKVRYYYNDQFESDDLLSTTFTCQESPFLNQVNPQFRDNINVQLVFNKKIMPPIENQSLAQIELEKTFDGCQDVTIIYTDLSSDGKFCDYMKTYLVSGDEIFTRNSLVRNLLDLVNQFDIPYETVFENFRNLISQRVLLVNSKSSGFSKYFKGNERRYINGLGIFGALKKLFERDNKLSNSLSHYYEKKKLVDRLYKHGIYHYSSFCRLSLIPLIGFEGKEGERINVSSLKQARDIYSKHEQLYLCADVDSELTMGFHDMLISELATQVCDQGGEIPETGCRIPGFLEAFGRLGKFLIESWKIGVGLVCCLVIPELIPLAAIVVGVFCYYSVSSLKRKEVRILLAKKVDSDETGSICF